MHRKQKCAHRKTRSRTVENRAGLSQPRRQDLTPTAALSPPTAGWPSLAYTAYNLKVLHLYPNKNFQFSFSSFLSPLGLDLAGVTDVQVVDCGSSSIPRHRAQVSTAEGPCSRTSSEFVPQDPMKDSKHCLPPAALRSPPVLHSMHACIHYIA